MPRDTVLRRLELESRNNRERFAALRAMFEQAGCSGGRLSEDPVKHASTPNLVCTLPGETDGPAIIVGAHLDAVTDGHGIVDNWSGASLLPSLFEALSKHPRRHTIVFIGFADEEKGLVGSKEYAKRFKKEPERVAAMVNIDTVGLDRPAVWLSRADKRLVRWLSDVATVFRIQLAATNIDAVGTTDSESFRTRKIPTIAFHSVTQATLPILHTPKDRREAIRPDDYYDTYQLLTAYLAYVDLKIEGGTPGH